MKLNNKLFNEWCEKIRQYGISYCARETGLSFATIDRFLRTGDITTKTYDKLKKFLKKKESELNAA